MFVLETVPDVDQFFQYCGSDYSVVLKFAGAVYLLWLAWQAVRPGTRSPFEARELPAEPPRKLFARPNV